MTKGKQPTAAAPVRQYTPRQVVSAAGLFLLVAGSAYAVISSSHGCRQLYTQLQLLEASRWQLQEEYGRLLLEQSTWASHHRVESVARSELNMEAPGLERFKVVTQ